MTFRIVCICTIMFKRFTGSNHIYIYILKLLQIFFFEILIVMFVKLFYLISHVTMIMRISGIFSLSFFLAGYLQMKHNVICWGIFILLVVSVQSAHGIQLHLELLFEFVVNFELV